MPKIYQEHYLKTLKPERLRELILEWQELKQDNLSLTEQVNVSKEYSYEDLIEHNIDDLKHKIYGIIDTWAGRLIGRKINNVHPGPPGPLENVVEKIIHVIANAEK